MNRRSNLHAPAAGSEGAPHRPRTTLVRLLDLAVFLALWGLLVAVVYGHWGGAGAGLSLAHSYVTEYMKAGPRWPWLTVGSFVFAVLLQMLALGFLLRSRKNFLLLLGCMLLASASMGTFFMSYAPVREVELPPGLSTHWWAPRWWFTAVPAQTAYEHGMADAYSDVHYRAIRLVLCCAVAGILLVGTASGKARAHPFFVKFTWSAVAVMALLFIACDHLVVWRGAAQRTGFVIMYAWLWLAWGHCFQRTR